MAGGARRGTGRMDGGRGADQREGGRVATPAAQESADESRGSQMWPIRPRTIHLMFKDGICFLDHQTAIAITPGTVSVLACDL